MKEIQNNDVEALTSLGLTLLQAKGYLALVKSGNATIKEISKTAGVARQDLYRITSELQKLGLVERVIATPTEFKAIELTEGLSILLQRVHEKEAESHKKILQLMQRYKDKKEKAKLQEDETQFSLLSEQLAVRKEEKTLDNVQRSFDVIASCNNPHSVIFVDMEKIVEALQRGVEIRVIIDKPDEKKLLSDITKQLKKYSTFKIRCIPNAPKALTWLYDKKEAWICTCTHPVMKECPTLRTNNPCLLSILQDYFEIMWITAMESNTE
jgi:sugar-specific transcriptional regulator TrmB